MSFVVVLRHGNRHRLRRDNARGNADLLDPKWKGKRAIEAKDEDWFASVVDVMGREPGLQFFRELAARNGVSVRLGHTLLTNLVISGEVPLALTVYSYMPEQARKKGAPIQRGGESAASCSPVKATASRRRSRP